jgi:NhaP-type Na+/H+ or K+/H+ antiporter
LATFFGPRVQISGVAQDFFGAQTIGFSQKLILIGKVATPSLERAVFTSISQMRALTKHFWEAVNALKKISLFARYGFEICVSHK